MTVGMTESWRMTGRMAMESLCLNPDSVFQACLDRTRLVAVSRIPSAVGRVAAPVDGEQLPVAFDALRGPGAAIVQDEVGADDQVAVRSLYPPLPKCPQAQSSGGERDA
jgi:hypothetical protein